MTPESAFQSQLRVFLELMLSPIGIAALIAFVALLVAMASSSRLKWVIMALLLWVSSMSYYVPLDRPSALRQAVILTPPFNQLQAYSRPLCIAFLGAMLVPLLTSHRGWRIRLLGGSVLAYFAFELLMSFRMLAAGAIDRGLTSVLVYPLVFMTLGVGLARWLQTWEEARRAIGAIVAAAGLFLLGTCYQLLINRGAIVHGDRLYGTTGNPQQAAMLIATALPPAIYTVARGDTSKFWRFLLCGIVGFLVIFLLWTGSRTGLVMGMAGAALMFRARIGRLLGMAIVISLFGLLAMQIYEEATLSVAGMFLRGDNRTEIWSALWGLFQNNMLWGGMSSDFGVGESSYLSTAANMGLFGVAPLVFTILLVTRMLYKLQRYRRRLGEHRQMVDLVTAGLISMALGALFEAYLLGTLTFQVFCIYIYLAVGTFLLDTVKAGDAVAAGGEHAAQQYEMGQDVEEPAAANLPDPLPQNLPVPLEHYL